MWPELFTIPIFDLPVRSFGLLVALGFIVAVAVASKLAARYGNNLETDPLGIADVSWWILIGVILGARLAFVLVNLDHYSKHPGDILKVWEGGLVMYGGLILAVLLGVWKAKRIGMPAWQSLDYGLTAGFLGQAIGRIGCFLVGDDYGAPTDVAWAITFPDPLRTGSAFAPELSTVAVHPTQFYMSAKALSLFLLGLFVLKRKKFHGQVSLILLMVYAVLRYVVEMFRFDMEARGGIYREGHGPEDVDRYLFENGITNNAGQIIDLEGFRTMMRNGVENASPQLILSTSQMVGIATFLMALVLYFVLARRADLKVKAPTPK
ncbi:MAG: prolipoprotein diacylglyceryl transferase [Planctomycetes bacterium]|nr:prolipoprotein diacylglyceryl transferase [Planctomycetota bacterium]MCP4770560.1 prolipoprotein diacylglyceryl transferase [Planctomycetota bacterium]MCP4860349.1 prolipoprotein diacylglyceryl transferase [Planctomycetota bacterium]